MDKKNRGCDIPTAKHAGYRRAEAFGELPKVKSKGKPTEEVLNEKMQYYLQMYKKQHTPQVRGGDPRLSRDQCLITCVGRVHSGAHLVARVGVC